MSVPNNGLPVMNDRVPSMGSSTLGREREKVRDGKPGEYYLVSVSNIQQYEEP